MSQDYIRKVIDMLRDLETEFDMANVNPINLDDFIKITKWFIRTTPEKSVEFSSDWKKIRSIK